MRGGEACAPIWRWRRGLLAVSGMSPTPGELRRVYPGVYPGLGTEGHASLMRSRRALGPARAPFFGTFGAVFSPARGAPCFMPVVTGRARPGTLPGHARPVTTGMKQVQAANGAAAGA